MTYEIPFTPQIKKNRSQEISHISLELIQLICFKETLEPFEIRFLLLNFTPLICETRNLVNHVMT